MIRATTPTITLTLTGDPTLDLTQADKVIVTIASAAGKINKTGEDLMVEAKKISFSLTQAESLKLSDGLAAEIQVNWMIEDGAGDMKRLATLTKKINISKQLLPEVISDELPEVISDD